MKRHSSVIINYGGREEKLSICVSVSKLPSVRLFSNVSGDCRPIATPSRRYSQADKDFIEAEIKQLLAEEIIEPSSPGEPR